MKLPFLISLATFLRRPTPPPSTVSQKGIQARAIRHLIAHGRITARDIIQMGTTDAHKMLTRMRRIGVLGTANDPCWYHLKRNHSGHGYHRVHIWTGKLPLSWLNESWAKGDRRQIPRGNQ